MAGARESSCFGGLKSITDLTSSIEQKLRFGILIMSSIEMLSLQGPLAGLRDVNLEVQILWSRGMNGEVQISWRVHLVEHVTIEMPISSKAQHFVTFEVQVSW